MAPTKLVIAAQCVDYVTHEAQRQHAYKEWVRPTLRQRAPNVCLGSPQTL
jgi:hypothetical protein